MEVKNWPKLYKKSSKDKEQQWDIKVVPVSGEPGKPDCADIVVNHGQVDGKIQTSTVHVTQGKNLGKANATTPYTQAWSEAEAKWLKQKDKGYSEERGGGSMELKPMLAHKYEDCKDKVTFPAYLQPKLDGVRCLAHRESETKVRLISRQGKDFGTSLDHIRDTLLNILDVGETWDGELYVHGMTFQKLISLVKKDQPDSKKLEYHVYDKISDERFSFRNSHLVENIPYEHPTIKFVWTAILYSHVAVESAHEKFVSEGYEGVMLRVGDCTYKQGYRSRELLKVKSFKDGEFKILDIVPGIGKMEDQGIFVCEMPDGTRFNCKPKGRDELRQDYLANKDKYIGKMLIVSYFEMTDSEHPVPRFPSGIAVRDYE